MNDLEWFVGAILALIAAGIALWVLFGIGLASVGIRRRNWWAIIFGVIIALLPFASHWWSNLRAEQNYRGRLEQIAQLPRHPLPADYPRTAIVNGSPTPPALLAYMVLGYLDEVRSDAHGPRGSSFRPRASSPQCRAAAYGYLQGSVFNNRAFDVRVPDMQPCWEETAADVRDADLPDDALIIRRDGEAINRAPGNTVWSGGIVEISVRQKGSEKLIDYAEKVHAEKSRSPFLPLPVSMETGVSPDPDKMVARMFGSPNLDSAP